MFTGIIETIGKLESRKRTGSLERLTFSAGSFKEPLEEGESIAVNGVCLTVADFGRKEFSVDAVAETIKTTTLGNLRVGEKVNLERAVKAGGRFGGHFVSGHVDGVGKIISVSREGENTFLKIEPTHDIMPLLVLKGSIALDGVSLTIQNLTGNSFSVVLIPYTLDHTTLGERKTGEAVNLEADMIAKYVKQSLLHQEGNRSRLTVGGLKEQGF
ncbi:MAG: riboflavin synthase [Candidatus Omnitrophica bacterium]|nr:riboflavin synthase [Candidatus Omnitrophota bacterium]